MSAMPYSPMIRTVFLAGAVALFCDPLAAQVPFSGIGVGVQTLETTKSGPPHGWVFAGNASGRYHTWTDIAQELPVGVRCSIIAAGPYMTTGTHIKHGSV